MPKLSDTMEVGTILHWHVDVGDDVSAGDVLADIETDKATMELQSFDDGTVDQIIVGVGDHVVEGQVVSCLQSRAEKWPIDFAAVSCSSPVGSPSTSLAMPSMFIADVIFAALKTERDTFNKCPLECRTTTWRVVETLSRSRRSMRRPPK